MSAVAEAVEDNLYSLRFSHSHREKRERKTRLIIVFCACARARAESEQIVCLADGGLKGQIDQTGVRMINGEKRCRRGQAECLTE